MKNERTTPQPFYRQHLSEELAARSGRNPRYSLRSFARDLKLSPQRLSDLIRGRYGLSAEQASLISERLDLSEDQHRRFVASAEMHHARSTKKRRVAEQEFQRLSENVSTLALDSFQVISEWYHYAILELTYVQGFRSDSKWIARQLGITPFQTEQAIERLKRLDLLTEQSDGQWICSQDFVVTPSGIPSDALKKFHRQILEKALDAITLQSVAERDVASVVMAIDPTRMNEAKEDLKNFRREFSKKYGSGPKQKEVYCLGVQFFRLQQKSED